MTIHFENTRPPWASTPLNQAPRADPLYCIILRQPRKACRKTMGSD